MLADGAGALDTEIRSPVTGAVLGTARLSGPADVELAVARARAAQPSWAALPFDARGAILRRFVRAAAADERVLAAIIGETGKPRYEAEGIELLYTLELTRALSGRKGRRMLDDEWRRPGLFRSKRVCVVRHPYGVAGVIGPWNWPLLNNFADAVPPLLAGNSVVLKPSPLAPLTSQRIEGLWRELDLPQHVVQVVTGGPEAAEALIDTVDVIFFTGSQSAGRAVARRCAARPIPAMLELGGKSPMIVLADADVPRAARGALWSAFANGGQVCIRTERALVDASIVERFTELVAQGAAGLRQSVAWGEGDVGPVRRIEHLAVLESQIADAIARGAAVVTGGTRQPELGPHYFAPTILAGCTAQMRIMQEETFGPVLPIMAVEGAEEAVRCANDPPGGLSGSIWTHDISLARALARQLRTGSVCINDVMVNYLCVEAPLGGVPPSGIGFRHGPEALRQFCRTEVIVEDRPGCGRVSGYVARRLGFPYDARVLDTVRWVMRRRY